MDAEMPEICAEFTIGTMVWAKLCRDPPWPAIIISPKGKENEKKRKIRSHKYVLFFGSKDYNWVKRENLYPFDDYFPLFSADEDAELQTAIKAALKYLQESPMFENNLTGLDENYKENMKQHWLVNCSNQAIAEAKNEKKYQSPNIINSMDENQKENNSKRLLEEYSDQAIEEAENEKKRQKLKRKNAPAKDSTQSSVARKKSKMSPVKDVRKQPKHAEKPCANVRVPNLQKCKDSFATYARKEPKRTRKHEANKADLKKNTSSKNAAHSCKASKKPKITVSTKDSKRGPKYSKKPKANNKTGMRKVTSKGNSAQPRKAKVKTKTSASAKNLRGKQKRTSKPQVIVKKSKICYMSSSGSSFVFPGPSTSSRVPEIANGRIVYDTDRQRRSFIRGPLQPVPLTLGFVGIGELARALVSHLVKVGMHVLIWNRTASKCSDLVSLGAILCDTPADVAAESDIVFCSVRGFGPITEVCFGGLIVGLNGIVPGLKRNNRIDKGFVMLSSIRPETSIIISQDFRKVSAQYLEAQALLKSQSENCDIRVLCAGDKSLFEKLPQCFASTKAQFIYLDSLLGEASRMKYAHTITHVGYALSLIEALAVLHESEKPVENLIFILDELDNVSPVMRNKIEDIIFHRRDHGGTIRELKDTLKELYEWYPKKPLHLATAAFEALDYASRKGADNSNISAVYDLLV